MRQKYQTVRGFRDIFGEDSKKMQFIVKKFSKIAEEFGLNNIMLPIVEYTDLFIRGVGEGTDIVDKEMFTFNYEENSLCLRPEMTASFVRAASNHNLYHEKVYYFGPCFRKERPQKGRYRQFFQFGVELLGSKDVSVEIDTFDMIIRMLQSINCQFQIKINIIPQDKSRYTEILKRYLIEVENKLSKTSLERLEKNKILRILDSKEDEEILKKAPKITDFLTAEENNRLNKIVNFIRNCQVECIIDPNLVRGLDYYNGIVFECVSKNIESRQNALCGGGRYDSLFETFGLQKTYAIGFGIGVDRLMDQLEIGNKKITKIGIINTTEFFENFLHTDLFDQKGQPIKIKKTIERLPSDIKEGLKEANTRKMDFVVIVDDKYKKEKKIHLKNMETGEQILSDISILETLGS